MAGAGRRTPGASGTPRPTRRARGDESLEALRTERDARAREAAEAQERYLRTLADFENFRRRTGREREDWRRQAQEALLREILPVVDNFERALAAPPAPGTSTRRSGPASS